MTDAPFIAAGWLGTAAAVGLYTVVLAVRTRRAIRASADHDRRPR
jgi:hypothetical protein